MAPQARVPQECQALVAEIAMSKAHVKIPPRLKDYMHYGRIPAWFLLLMLVPFVALGFGTFIPDFWSHRLVNFAGEKVTAYVVAKHINRVFQGPSDRIIEAGYIAKDGSHQLYELRVTYDIYSSVEVGSPIGVVYDPKRPERAYPAHGQDAPIWLQYLALVTFPIVCIGAIVRYRNILFRKV
jgi:hypothetical protein